MGTASAHLKFAVLYKTRGAESSEMWVKVKGLGGREWKVDVMGSDTIVKVKEMILLTSDVETTAEIMLIKNKVALKDEHTLAHYGIKEDTRLSVVFNWTQCKHAE